MSADPWDEAVTKARQAIYDDGRGMIGRNAGYLQDRVARAILAERKEASDALASKEEEIRKRDMLLCAVKQQALNAAYNILQGDVPPKVELVRVLYDIGNTAHPSLQGGDVRGGEEVKGSIPGSVESSLRCAPDGPLSDGGEA